MEDFVVRKDSWHYRFLNWYDDFDMYPWKKPRDFYSYWRKFMIATGLVSCAGAVVLGIVGLIGYHSVTNPMGALTVLVSIVIMVLAILAVLLVCYVIQEGSAKIAKDAENSEPGIIRTKYRSWKDQYCPMVRFED